MNVQKKALKNITDEMMQEYLEHHRKKDSDDNSDFILEDFQSEGKPLHFQCRVV